MKELISYIKRVWAFLKRDSWPSLAVTLILAFVFIKFVFFPGLSAITGSALPLVIVESCSMYHHDPGFENTFTSSIYEDHGISIEDTKNWIFQNGFAKGDVIFVVGADDIEIGDVIIFNAGSAHPLIHRVIETNETYATKGDNYRTNYKQLDSEKKISEDQIIGKALFKVPLVGWIKLIFFEMGRSPGQRGLCN